MRVILIRLFGRVHEITERIGYHQSLQTVSVQSGECKARDRFESPYHDRGTLLSPMMSGSNSRLDTELCLALQDGLLFRVSSPSHETIRFWVEDLCSILHRRVKKRIRTLAKRRSHPWDIDIFLILHIFKQRLSVWFFDLTEMR